MRIILDFTEELQEALEDMGIDIESELTSAIENALGEKNVVFNKKREEIQKETNEQPDRMEGSENINFLSEEEYDEVFIEYKKIIKGMIKKYGDEFFEDTYMSALDDFDNEKTELSLWEKISE